MPSTDEQFDWLVRSGREALRALKLVSTKPLKVDWAETRFSPWQQVLLEEQLQLRIRSATRFPDPELWLWTDRSLQQASDWLSAMTKANFFQANSQVIDACCGAGADLVALAQQHQVVAVDRDRHMLRLARANMQAHDREADYVQAEIPASLSVTGDVCLHADPDRRRGQERETRTTQAESFSPPLTDIMKLGERARACVVKLAPATELELPSDVDWRRAWLGSGRECPQQLLMRGDLNWLIPAGQRGAVLVEHPEAPFIGRADTRCYTTDEPEQFIVEPHAALYAAGLAAAWAEAHNLSALPHASSYFTGESIVASPWAQAFEVQAHMSWDERRVKKWLKANQVGTVEVKTRQVPLDANLLQRQLSQRSGLPITCLLYRIGKSIRVAMARRTEL